MAWTILIVAGVLEIGWAVGLKYTEGFTRLYPTIATVAAMVVSRPWPSSSTATSSR